MHVLAYVPTRNGLRRCAVYFGRDTAYYPAFCLLRSHGDGRATGSETRCHWIPDWSEQSTTPLPRYDLLDPQVLPEELPEDTMPDFQHGSIRQVHAQEGEGCRKIASELLENHYFHRKILKFHRKIIEKASI